MFISMPRWNSGPFHIGRPGFESQKSTTFSFNKKSVKPPTHKVIVYWQKQMTYPLAL